MTLVALSSLPDVFRDQLRVHLSAVETGAGAAQHGISAWLESSAACAGTCVGRKLLLWLVEAVHTPAELASSVVVSRCSVPVPNAVCTEASLLCRSTGMWSTTAVWFIALPGSVYHKRCLAFARRLFGQFCT